MDNMETKDLNAEELEKVQDAELDDVSGGNDGSYSGEGMYCPLCRVTHSGIRHVFTIVKGNYKVFRCQKQGEEFYIKDGAYYAYSNYGTDKYLGDKVEYD